MSLRSIREKLNLVLYDSKEKGLRIVRFLNLLVSFSTIGILIYYYGFPLTEEEKDWSLLGVQFSFCFYIFYFIVRFVYDFEPKKFIKKNWFEGVMMLLLLLEGIYYNISDSLFIGDFFKSLGIVSFPDLSNVFLPIYFAIVVILEISRDPNIKMIPKVKLHPASIFVLCFMAIILLGTGLLMLPEMTTQQGSGNFLDSLFMSTSATCVTGLVVEDVSSFFTFKGHVILLILIKLGGLNIIAFGSFLAIAAKLGLRVKQHEVIEDFVNKDSTLSANSMLGKVIIWSTLIEIAGALVLFFSWCETAPFKSMGDKIFSSIFHSVSAFNNAGISLFQDGLFNASLKNNYLVQFEISLLIFFGALGFLAIFDIFNIKRILNRIKTPWKQIQFSSKIALYFSLLLVAIGTSLFFVLEFPYSDQNLTWYEQIAAAFFQSVTSRTAGFSTIDIGTLSYPSLIVMIFLMFIGSSSNSTGGGIKTSTFAILWAATISTIQGKKNVELYRRTICTDLILKAFAVFIFFIFAVLICVFLLSITERELLHSNQMTIMDLIFEEVSAFATVGLSTGITSSLSAPGKIVIILSMFVGRIGTLTVGYLFGSRIISKKYKYPSGHTMVG